ncbi:Ig-like domain-containing protein [Mesobacillus foraminis]|nr:Ig-like domain-containing protein [Mesobacillus foraminis]
MMVLFLSFWFGCEVTGASAASLGEGTYKVGEDISAGLNNFSVQEGTATILISRGEEVLLVETLDSDKTYSSNQFSARLRDGDAIEIYLDGGSHIEVSQTGKLDMKNIRAGYYEVDVDIPAGTYTLDIVNPDDSAYISILDNEYFEKESFSLFYEEVNPDRYTFSKGEKIYISSLIETINFKEVILVPKSITLSKTSLTLMVNRTAQLSATVNPSTARNKGVSWTSGNPAIATVDTKGNVKAVKVGKTTITATANGDKSITKTIPVTVLKIIPTSLKLNKSSLHISKKQIVKVTATVDPKDAADKTILWKSSNPKVATVDSQGNIKGLANGSATVTATAKDNPKVYKKVAVKVSTKTVKVNKTGLTLTAGKTAVLKATVSPLDSTDKAVKWTSSNTRIATVDSKGKVSGKTKGTATITATVKDAKAVKVKVTVTAPIPAKSVKLNKNSVTLGKGKTLALTATVSPHNTTNKTVKWKSSNTRVATVDSKGKVKAVGSGTARITASTINGKTTAATITVPYVKNLSAGKWKAGKDIPAGRYKITAKAGSGNLVIGMGTEDRFINEILSSEKDEFGVTAVTTDIKAGDNIEISGLDNVQFTRVANIRSNTLHSGYWTVGKDIAPGKYKITTPDYMGNLFIYRGDNLLVNEILAHKPGTYTVTSVTVTLKSGDRIGISGLDHVVFTKR